MAKRGNDLRPNIKLRSTAGTGYTCATRPMAKKSKIVANKRRKQTVARYAERRATLKEAVRTAATPQEREAAVHALNRLPRDASPVRVRNRDRSLVPAPVASRILAPDTRSPGARHTRSSDQLSRSGNRDPWRRDSSGSRQGVTGGAGPGTVTVQRERVVYARSIMFHGRPDNIDAGIKFVQSEAEPMLDKIEGCRGLAMLADRETGQCIVTSSWESEAVMLASDEQLRPLRDRGRDILGGSMQVDEWEIAIMHRTQHGECCRVSWLQGAPDAMTEVFREMVLPQLAHTRGFCSASLLVNRTTGLGCATTAWESRAAMEASRSAADDMRTSTATAAGGEILEVHEFDLVYAHLHVPQMT
jgi:quinol monooxygenase YgiN